MFSPPCLDFASAHNYVLCIHVCGGGGGGVHVHVHECMPACMRVCVYVCVHLLSRGFFAFLLCVCVCVCEHACICAHMCVCMHACLCVCMHVSMCACVNEQMLMENKCGSMEREHEKQSNQNEVVLLLLFSGLDPSPFKRERVGY